MSDSYMDDNIVKMTFDNKQFEQNAKQSLNTIEKLKGSMNFEASVKGLDKLEKSTAEINKSLNMLSGAVDKLNKKFSNLGVVGARVLENITDSLYSTSKRMLKALTVDPVKQGFQEYELKMSSVQTIMASTGASIKDVNQYLDELNTYSDKTIYSFKDMTSNIGKFTNAGVKLKDAVAAIQGISNVAAVAGANTNEASRAMYNFSQALSAGYVKLIDWKSIELANMATKEFKENLISVAEGLGTIKKVAGGYQTVTKDLTGKVSEAFTATKNFNDSLSHQWLTNDVLNKTLAIYSTDLTDITEKELNEYKVKTKNNKLTKEQALVLKKKEFEADLKQIGLTDKKIKQMEALSKKAFRSATEVKTWSQLFDTLKEAAGSGWAKTYEYIFGDKVEATKMLTRVNNVVSAIIDKNSELRNNILYDWHNYKGYDALVGKNGIFANLKKSIDSVIRPIHNAWYTAFPISEKLGKTLADITKSVRDFTKTLRLNKEDADNLEKTWTGIFMILKTGKDIITDIASTIGRAIGITGKKAAPLLSQILKITAKLEEFGQDVEWSWRVIKAVIEYTNQYFKITANIAGVAVYVFKNLGTIAGGVVGVIAGGIMTLSVLLAKVAAIGYNKIEPFISAINDELSKHQDIIDGVINRFKAIPATLGSIGDSALNMFKKLTDGFSINAEAAEVNGEKIKNVDNDIFKNNGINDKKRKKLNLTTTKQILANNVKVAKDHISKAKGVEKVQKAAANGILTAVKATGETLHNFGVTVSSNVRKFIANIKVDGIRYAVAKLFSDILAKTGRFFISIKDGIAKADIPGALGAGLSKVGETIRGIGSWFGDLFNTISKNHPVLSKLQGFLETITDKIHAIKDDLIGKAGDALSALGKAAKIGSGYFSRINDSIKVFTAQLAQMCKTITPSKVALMLFVGSILYVTLGIGKLLFSISVLMDQLTLKLVPAFAGLVSNLSTTVAAFRNHFLPTVTTTKLKITEFAQAIAILALSLTAMYKVLSTIDTDKLWDISAVFAVMMGAMTAMYGVTVLLNAVMNKMPATMTIVTFSASVAAMSSSLLVVAAAFKVLDTIDNTKGLLIKVSGIGIVLLALGTAMRIATKIDKPGMTAYTGSALTALAFALSLKSICKALNDITKLDTKNIVNNLGSFITIFLMVGGVARAASRMKFTSGVAMIALALSLKIAVSAFESLTEVDFGGIMKSIVAYTVVVKSIISLVLVISQGLNKIGLAVAGIGAGVLMMTFAIKMVIHIGELLNGADASTIIKGSAYVGAMMTLFTLLTKLGNFAQASNPKGLAKTFIGMGVAITGLIAAVYIFGSINVGKLVQGTIGVSALLLALGTSLRIMGDKVAKVNFKTIMSFILGVVLLSAELIVVSLLPFNDMVKGLAGLITVMASLSGAMVAMGYLMKYSKGNKKSIGAILGLIAETIVLTASLKILSEQPFDKMIAAAGSLAGTMLAYSNAMAITSRFASTCVSFKQNFSFIMSGIGGLAVITGALIALSTFGGNTNKIVASAGAISSSMLAYAGSLVIVSKLADKTPSTSVFKNVLAGVIMMGTVAAALIMVSQFGGDSTKIVASAVSISIGLFAFAGVMALVGATANLYKAISKAAGDIILGAGVVGVAIGVLAGILVVAAEAIGAGVKAFDEDGSNLKHFDMAFESIANAMGSIVDNTIGRISEASIKAVTGIFEAIVDFAKVGAKNQNTISDAVYAIGSVAELAHYGDNLKDVDLDSLGDIFVKISKAYKTLNENVSGEISDGTLKTLIAMIKAVGLLGENIDKIPSDNGMVQGVLGFKNYSEAIYEIGELGANVSYAIRLLDRYKVDIKDLKLIKSTINILGEMGNAINEVPSDRGMLQVFVTGTKDYVNAIRSISALGYEIGVASKNIKHYKVTEDDISGLKSSVGVFSAVATALGEVPPSGGIISMWAGDWTNSIPAIMVSVGDMAATLSDNKGKFKSAGISKSSKSKIVNAISIFSAVAKACADAAPEEGLGEKVSDFLAGIIGKDSVSQMSSFLDTVLPKFCSSLATGVKDFGDVSEDTVNKAVGAINAMASVLGAITTAKDKGVDFDTGWFNDSDFERVGKGLEALADPLKKFSKNLKGYDVSGTAQVINSMSAFMNRMAQTSIKSACDNMDKLSPVLESFSMDYKNSMSRIRQSDSAAASDVKTAITSINDAMKLADVKALSRLDSLGNAITALLKIDKNTTALSFTANMRNILDTIASYQPKFKNAGEKLVEMFNKGLGSKDKNIKTTAGDAADKAIKELDSRNKDFEDTGVDSITSFAKGLQNKEAINAVEYAAATLGKKAKEALDKSLDEHSPSKLFEKDGIFAVQGFVKGLKNKLHVRKAVKSSEDLGHASDKGLKHSLDEHSPSKVFEQSGIYGVIGFNNGLASGTKASYTMGKKLGSSSISGIFASINSMVDAGKKLGGSWIQQGYNWIIKQFPSVGNFMSGLQKKISGVVKNPLKMGKDFYQKTAKEMTDGIEKNLGLKDMKLDSSLPASGVGNGKTGKGAKKAGKSIGKALHNAVSKGLTDKQQLAKLLQNYFNTFVKLVPKYDPFNKKNLSKSGYATAEYLAKSFKDKNLRSAALYFGDSFANEINAKVTESLKKAGKKLSFKNYSRAVKKESKTVVKSIADSFKVMNQWLDSIDPSKDLRKTISSIPSAVAGWANNYRPAEKYAKGAYKTLVKHYKDIGKSSSESDRKAKKNLQRFANYLYTTDSEYTKHVKRIDKNQKKIKKLNAKAKKYEDILNDPKSTKKQIKTATKGLERISKATDKARKAITENMTSIAKGSEKALKQFQKNIKDSVDATLKFSDVGFNTGINLMEHFMYSSKKVDYTTGKLAHNLAAYSTTQITAWNTYRKEIAEMEKAGSIWQTYGKGWGTKFVDWLKDQGFEAADTVHMLAFASEKDVKEIIDNYAKSVEASGQVLADNYFAKGEDVEHFIKNIDELTKKGFNPAIIQEMIDKGVDGNPMVDVMLTWNKEMIDRINKQYEGYDKLGQTAADSITGSMTVALAKSVANTSSDAKSAGAKMADNFCDGMIKELGIKFEPIVKSLSQIAKPTKKQKTSTKGGAAIKKSSKSFSTDGLKTVGSLAKTAITEISKLGNTATSISDEVNATIVDSATQTAIKISKILDDSGLLDLSIRPTLDLSDIQSKASNLMGLLDTTTTSNLALQVAYANSAPTNNPVNVTVNNDNSKVEKKLDELNSGIQSTLSTMTDLKIVMDTNVLVGSIAKPMDKKLGQKAKKKGR